MRQVGDSRAVAAQAFMGCWRQAKKSDITLGTAQAQNRVALPNVSEPCFTAGVHVDET
jgi:hypothetical protein